MPVLAAPTVRARPDSIPSNTLSSMRTTRDTPNAERIFARRAIEYSGVLPVDQIGRADVAVGEHENPPLFDDRAHRRLHLLGELLRS